MKSEVSYKLEDEVRLEIIKVKNAILNKLNDVEIYLYGSIAKGAYSKDSDMIMKLLKKMNVINI